MQKKIIALAIASALTVPAMAQAASEVYGQANLSYDRVSTGEGASTLGIIGDSAASPGNYTKSVDRNQLVSNNSRLGLKGSEDMGGGLSAVWQMEGTVTPDAGGSTLFNRNTFLGVKSGDLGTVLLGNYDTPYKTAFRKLDVFADSAVADNRTVIFLRDARRTNSVNYISPSFSGFSVAAATVFGSETANSGSIKGSAMSVAGMYEQGPIYASLAIDNVKYGSAGSGDLAAPAGSAAKDTANLVKLGGGYTMSPFAVNAIVEKTTTKVNVGGAETTGTNVYVGGKYSLSGTDAVKLAIGQKGATTTTGAAAAKNGVTQVTVGYDHSMSKATSVYALYTIVTAEEAAGAKNADPAILSLGMKHAF